VKTLARRSLAAAAIAYGLLLFDWRAASGPAPVVRQSFRVAAPLEAGASIAPIAPPLPVVRGGYGPAKAVATRERDPLHARAVVLRAGGRSLAIVLLDVVLVPDALSRSLEAHLADLGLDAVLVLATHTHSSVGAYDERFLAQVVAMGRYRADVANAIVGAAERSVRSAVAVFSPARVRTAQARIVGWAANRSSDAAPVDDALHVVAIERASGGPIATLAVVAAHPTLEPRTTPELSADYPGAAMRRLEQSGGVALLLQGAEGDAALPGRGAVAIEAAATIVAESVAQAVREAVPPAEPTLAFTRARITLPAVEVQAVRPFVVQRPLSNALQHLLPRDANVEVLTIGDVTLLAVPGEPTAMAARRWLDTSDSKTRVVALADGYLGYIDAPERVREGTGESPRAWFGPELADAIGEGLRAARQDERKTP
jgi:Neutral/alkaline non-lysosomal ceramidase, N-terminal